MRSKVIIALVALAVVGGGLMFTMQNKDESGTSKSSSQSSKADSPNESKKTSNDGLKLSAQTVGQQPDCSLYTFDELGKIWGVTFTDTDVNGSKVSELTGPGTKLYECDYNETNSGQGVSFVIQHKEYSTTAAAVSEMTNVRSSAKYGDKVYFIQEEKSGVGDEAFFSKGAGTGSLANTNQQMYIRKDNVVFLLSGVNLAGTDDSYKDKLVSSYKLHFN